MEYQITQAEILAKWQEIIQKPDVSGENIIAAVRLARWVERRLKEQGDPDPALAEYQYIKAQQRPS